jgi:hypothetical protein
MPLIVSQKHGRIILAFATKFASLHLIDSFLRHLFDTP